MHSYYIYYDFSDIHNSFMRDLLAIFNIKWWKLSFFEFKLMEILYKTASLYSKIYWVYFTVVIIPYIIFVTNKFTLMLFCIQHNESLGQLKYFWKIFFTLTYCESQNFDISTYIYSDIFNLSRTKSGILLNHKYFLERSLCSFIQRIAKF